MIGKDWLLLKHIDIYFQRILVNKRNIFCISYWPRFTQKCTRCIYCMCFVCVCVCVHLYASYNRYKFILWLYSYFSYFLCRINKKKKIKIFFNLSIMIVFICFVLEEIKIFLNLLIIIFLKIYLRRYTASLSNDHTMKEPAI